MTGRGPRCHNVHMKSMSVLTRRQFLATTAATAAVAPMIVRAATLGRGGRTPPSGRINLACIGWGTIAMDTTPGFLNDDRVQVMAVCDVNKESGRYGYQGERRGGREPGRRTINAFYGQKTGKPNYDGCRIYEDFREMLERESIDAVQISTPDHWHAALAIYCARRGKHIYGQKPLALTIDQGRHMADEVARAGITWQTGSQQRSQLYFRMACEYVRNGRIGKLSRVLVGLPGGHTDWNQMASHQAPEPVPEGLNYDLWEGPAPHRPYRPAILPLNWRHNYDYSGGMITDWGAHHIDIAQWGLNMDSSGPVKLEDLRGEIPPRDALYNTATKFHGKWTYANGVSMVVADEAQVPHGITFEGEDGRKIHVTRDVLEFSPESIRQERIGENEIHLYESKDHCANFIDCILSGKPTAAPIETAHRSITIAHLMNIGLRLGRTTLRWDPDHEQVIGDDAANRMLSRPMRRPWTLRMRPWWKFW